ncbi:MAG TPA: aquaporin [Gemmatimonadaceae bacterium]
MLDTIEADADVRVAVFASAVHGDVLDYSDFKARSAAMKSNRQAAPFFEAWECPALARRALAECVGTAALTVAVVFAAHASWLGQLRPLARGVGIPAALAALTLSLGPVTGAHFNPLVTASQWARGHRDTRSVLAYLVAQIVGAVVGAVAAGQLLGVMPQAVPAPLAVVVGSEIFASAGLITIVLVASLVASPSVGLMAVIAWLVMINLTAPAGPFANPVLALATPLALGSTTASAIFAHVGAEIVGAGMAVLLIVVMYPRAVRPATAE